MVRPRQAFIVCTLFRGRMILGIWGLAHVLVTVGRAISCRTLWGLANISLPVFVGETFVACEMLCSLSQASEIVWVAIRSFEGLGNGF